MATSPKFQVSVVESGPLFRVEIKSVRTGRTWHSTSRDDLGNSAERAMVLEEYLNGGHKLANPSQWIEV